MSSPWTRTLVRGAALAAAVTAAAALPACTDDLETSDPLDIGVAELWIARGALTTFPVLVDPARPLDLSVRPLDDAGLARAAWSPRSPGGWIDVAVAGLAAGEDRLGFFLGDELVATRPIVVREPVSLMLLADVFSSGQAFGTPGIETLTIDSRGAVTLDVMPVDVSGQFLAGGHMLEIPDDAPASVVHGEPDRLVLIEPAPGEYDIPLGIPGRELGHLRVIATREADIAEVHIAPTDEATAVAGRRVCVFGLPRTAAQVVISAAPLAWSADGVDVGTGDRLCYALDPAAPATTVRARANGHDATVAIHGRALEVRTPGRGGSP